MSARLSHLVASPRGIRRIAACLAAMTLLATSCSTSNPLRLREYSRNIVIYPDASVVVEGVTSRPKNVVADLRAQGIADNSYLVIHVHHDTSKKIFDSVVNLLREEGYTQLSFEIFDD